MKQTYRAWLIAVIVIIAMAFTACPTNDNPGIPQSIIMKTAITGNVSIGLKGENIAVNWGDGKAEIIGNLDVMTDFPHNYTISTERTITITGVIYELSCNGMELKSLDCKNNSLSNLDVSDNPEIVRIECNNNNLETAAVLALLNSLPTRSVDNKGYIDLSGNPGVVVGSKSVYGSVKTVTSAAKFWEIID